MVRRMAERIRKLSRTLERRSCLVCSEGCFALPMCRWSSVLGLPQPPCAPPELHRRPSCLIRNPSTFSRPATLRQSSSSSCRLAALRSRAARTWACAVLWISRHAQPTAASRKRLRSPTAYHRCSSPSSAATGVGLLPCVQGDTSMRRGSRRIGGMCVRYIRGSTRKDAWDRSFSVRVR